MEFVGPATLGQAALVLRSDQSDASGAAHERDSGAEDRPVSGEQQDVGGQAADDGLEPGVLELPAHHSDPLVGRDHRPGALAMLPASPRSDPPEKPDGTGGGTSAPRLSSHATYAMAEPPMAQSAARSSQCG